MINYNEIINKLKDILSNELGNKKIFDKDVAKALDINYDSFRKAKARGSIPYYEIMSFLAKRNISINWFFFNQLPESLVEQTSNYIILKYQRSVITSAGGGAINYQEDFEQLIIDKKLLDYINTNYKYTDVLKVLGDSMEPDIKDKSLIFVDKMLSSVKNGNIYVVNTPDGTFIKKVNIDNDKVYLKSNNQAYETIVLNIEDITIVGRVCGVFKRI
ncbi:S24 family peptidase [Halarcobacter sp.]|uniref:S24 family peptidase n=1 Tax=Halarcobacter sp. TaxID=2321133 RepID=UPI0029F5B896|nr:S24 family peptidase [Halarcobacter sp.]